MENSKSNQADDCQNEQGENSSENSENPVAADIVSLEALVNVLIRNGICTAEELFEEEQTRRLYLNSVKDISIVKTDGSADSHQRSSDKRNRSWLKRNMSKRRWTRKLGKALFGWEWRKVKVQNNKGV
ncbi:hypothetical protein IH824_04795, partial [candidate division KSB1 bacterium]|nr:hypothetical protein [candidate division KSB1 bacterium]